MHRDTVGPIPIYLRSTVSPSDRHGDIGTVVVPFHLLVVVVVSRQLARLKNPISSSPLRRFPRATSYSVARDAVVPPSSNSPFGRRGIDDDDDYLEKEKEEEEEHCHHQ